MLEFLKTKISPIGLDIGCNSVKMLQLERKGGRITVAGADEIQLSSEIFDDPQAGREAVINAITRMLAKEYFQNNEVITCLPSSKLIIRSLRLDTFDEVEVEKTIKSGVLERFGLDMETHEIRYISAGDVRQSSGVKNEIILFAIDKESLKDHIKMLEETGLVPVAIDTVPFALFRSLHRSLRRFDDQDKVNVFVDIGSSHTTVIISRAGEIIFAKQINIAGSQINQRIASRLGIGFDEAVHLRSKLRNKTDAVEMESGMVQIVIDSMYSVIDELAKEISLCFRYYAVTFRGQQPERIMFAGGEAYEQTLVNALEQNLGIEVEVTEPLRDFDLSGIDSMTDRKTTLCEWAVASGLCLKGMDSVRGGLYERN
ncbi:MAG: type IV pilus assembly protein PilM [Sedimentisphaerales bacterium]|nr:type IV pilus assembly protein PilM [Sedimentisphaerales bacterium]